MPWFAKRGESGETSLESNADSESDDLQPGIPNCDDVLDGSDKTTIAGSTEHFTCNELYGPDVRAGIGQDQHEGGAQDGIRADLQKVLGRQKELIRLFTSRIHSDQVQGKAFDRLHDELQQYKRNFVRHEMMPLFGDVIFCYDLASQSDQGACDQSAAQSAHEGKRLQALSRMLLDILEKYEIESYRCDGDDFDPKFQQRIDTVPTDVEENDKKIAERGAVGFRSQESVVRREQVKVFRYRPSMGER